MEQKQIVFKQITLITDGCSNQGISPVEAAGTALQQNITVNVIGITDTRNNINHQGLNEVKNIAAASGGLYQIVPLEQIAQTVQMVTRQAINKTVQQIVHNQLTEILGKDEISSLPPLKRLKVTEMMDNIAEYSNLKILLLIDSSASMQNKISKIEEAILDFYLSLTSRAGNYSISIATFPGNNEVLDIRIPWTKEINQIGSLIKRIKPSGNTPTGPAILSSIRYFSQNGIKENYGVLDEYII